MLSKILNVPSLLCMATMMVGVLSSSRRRSDSIYSCSSTSTSTSTGNSSTSTSSGEYDANPDSQAVDSESLYALLKEAQQTQANELRSVYDEWAVDADFEYGKHLLPRLIAKRTAIEKKQMECATEKKFDQLEEQIKTLHHHIAKELVSLNHDDRITILEEGMNIANKILKPINEKIENHEMTITWENIMNDGCSDPEQDRQAWLKKQQVGKLEFTRMIINESHDAFKEKRNQLLQLDRLINSRPTEPDLSYFLKKSLKRFTLVHNIEFNSETWGTISDEDKAEYWKQATKAKRKHDKTKWGKSRRRLTVLKRILRASAEF